MHRCWGILMLSNHGLHIAPGSRFCLHLRVLARLFPLVLRNWYSVEGCLIHPPRKFVILLFRSDWAIHRTHSRPFGISCRNLILRSVRVSPLNCSAFFGLLVTILWTILFFWQSERHIFSFDQVFRASTNLLLCTIMPFWSNPSIPVLNLSSRFSTLLALSLNTVQYSPSLNIFQSVLTQ